LRFGLREVQPDQPHDNAERIMHEMSDLIGVYQMLTSRALVLPTDRKRVNAKVEKVIRFLAYSRECGTLTDTAPSPPARAGA
jgi:hypothetical protein